jgi:hypothetical protein
VQCIELKEAKARGVGVGDYVKKERIKRKPTIWVAVSVTQDIHPQNKTKIQDIRGDVPPFFFFKFCIVFWNFFRRGEIIFLIVHRFLYLWFEVFILLLYLC